MIFTIIASAMGDTELYNVALALVILVIFSALLFLKLECSKK